jgi:hypothetical protein
VAALAHLAVRYGLQLPTFRNSALASVDLRVPVGTDAQSGVAAPASRSVLTAV